MLTKRHKMSTKVWRKAHKTPQYHLGPKPVWTKLNIFGSFQVLVKLEVEVVQNRQFIPTCICCNVGCVTYRQRID